MPSWATSLIQSRREQKPRPKRGKLTFVQWLEEEKACGDAIEWVEQKCRGRLDIAWKRCTRPGWMIWLIKAARDCKLRGWSSKRLHRVYKCPAYYAGSTFHYYVEGKKCKSMADKLRKLFTPLRWKGGKKCR